MSSWIHSKPIEQITWADLESLITDGVTEGQQIEFKGEIPGNKGNADPWASGGKMADFGRDRICEGLSAFLNSYGGTLFLGVKEGEKAPRPAVDLPAVPRSEELAKRFEDVVRSHFDPPVAGIAIRAVAKPNGDNGEGIIVFRVQSSNLAPHGFGRPSAAYVRRGASSEPMSMRDLQSVFWESRTKAEWVAQTRERFDQQRKKLMLENAAVSGGQRTFDNKTLYWPTPGISLRISAIPQGRLSGLDLFQWPGSNKGRAIRPSGKEFELVDYDVWHRGEPTDAWRLKGQGIWAREVSPSRYMSISEIEETGTVTVSSYVFGIQPERFLSHCFHHDLAFIPLAQVLFAAEILRRLAGQPHTPIELDVTIATCGDIYARPKQENVSHSDLVPMFELSEIGPFTWTRRSELNTVFTEMERQITAACGVAVQQPKTPNFEKVLAEKEHHFMPKGS